MGKNERGVGELIPFYPRSLEKVNFLLPQDCWLQKIFWHDLPPAHKKMAAEYPYLKEEGWLHFRAKAGRNRPTFLSLREDGNNITWVQKVGLSSYNQQTGLQPGQTVELRLEKDQFKFEIKE